MRTLCTSVLAFEAIVIGLAIVPAMVLADIDASVAVPVGLGLAVAAMVIAGLLRRFRFAYVLGSILQLVVIALGFVVPAMFVLGAIFAVLWVVAIRVGKQVESRPAPDVPPPA